MKALFKFKHRPAVSGKTARGQSLSEYLPIIGSIALVALVSFANLGDQVREQGADMARELAGQSQSAGNGTGGGAPSGGGSRGGSSGGPVDGPNGGSNGSPNGGSGSPGGGATGPDSGSPDAGAGDAGPGDSGGEADTGAGPGSGSAPGAGGGFGEPDNLNGGGSNGGSGGSGDGATEDEKEEEADPGLTLGDLKAFAEGIWDGLKRQGASLWNMIWHPIDTANQFITLGKALINDPEGTTQEILAEFKEDANKALHGSAFQRGQLIGENVSPATFARLAARLARAAGRLPDQKPGKPDGSRCASFAGDTLIHTPDGLTPIRELTLGDRVLARNDRSYEDRPQPITRLHGRQVDHYYRISTGYESIKATAEHPFYLQGQGWSPAKALARGNVIASVEGDIQLYSVSRIDEPLEVYNLTVAEDHSYFVADNGLWVHNANEVCDISKPIFEELLEKIPENKRELLKRDAQRNPQLQEAFQKEPKLADAWVKMEKLGADDAIRQNPGALRALNAPKGKRPDPSTYLDEAFIAQHLAKFDDGAVRITTRTKIDTYKTLGSEEAFVLPKGEYDNLLKETGGDLEQIEKRLGLNSGDLTGSDVVVAWIKRDNLSEVKIPSGNEGGVNSNWIPGGKTSGGISEGVLDISDPDIPYTEL